MLWQDTLHRFHHLVDIRLSQSKPLIEAQGGEELNLGFLLKIPSHPTPPKLHTYRLYAPCFQGHKAQLKLFHRARRKNLSR
jgi:hypothetical protein